VGTECNSDSVGKTESYCVSKMMLFVVIPAGMWKLNAIVTIFEDRQLLCQQDDGVCCYTGRYVGTECNSDSVGKTDSYCVSKMMVFVVIPAGIWKLNAIVKVLGRPTVTVSER